MLWFGGFGPDRFQPFFGPSGTVVGGEQVMGIRGMDSTVMLWCPHADSTWTLELDVASGSAGLEVPLAWPLAELWSWLCAV